MGFVNVPDADAFVALQRRVDDAIRDGNASVKSLLDICTALDARLKLLEKPSPPPPTGKRLLQSGDLEYIGAVKLLWAPDPAGSGDPNWGTGFTLRRVDGELRALTLGFNGNLGGFPVQWRLSEWRVADGSFVRSWQNIWPGQESLGNGGRYVHIQWDEERQGLWTVTAVDYQYHPDDEPCISFRKLNDDGTVSALSGPWQLSGQGATRTYTEVCPLPDGGLLGGFGGYLSLVNQGAAAAAMGQMSYGFSDPRSMPPGPIPFRKLVDHVGTRGARLPGRVKNYFDGQVVEWKPDPIHKWSPANEPVQGPDKWVEPFPDGKGRMVWGDSCFAHAFLNLPDYAPCSLSLWSLMGGRAWYTHHEVGRTLTCDTRLVEVHVYDPEKCDGGRVEPHEMFDLPIPGTTGIVSDHANVIHVRGTDVDGRNLYAMVYDPLGSGPKIHSWSIRAA